MDGGIREGSGLEGATWCPAAESPALVPVLAEAVPSR